MSARRTSRWARTCATAWWRCVKRCCPHDPAAARSTGWSGRYERVGGVGTKPSDLPPRRRSTAAALFLETRQSGSLSRFGGKATGIVLGAAAGGADQFTYCVMTPRERGVDRALSTLYPPDGGLS